MKTTHFLVIIASLALCLYACKKDGNNTNPSSIAGKWNIVSDSTYSGVGLGNHPVNYVGQPGDYFDFTTNGTVYTKEGTILDTLTYRIVSDKTIVISPFSIILNGVPETSYITTFTARSLVINAPRVLTPGGVFGRKISLSR
jgi:hypothetical protein